MSDHKVYLKELHNRMFSILIDYQHLTLDMYVVAFRVVMTWMRAIRPPRLQLGLFSNPFILLRASPICLSSLCFYA